MVSTYFSKRYFIYFAVFFLVWYPGSFVMYTLYQVAPSMVLYLGINAYYPLLLLIFAWLYFRKSANDWNDRFAVAIGWIILSFLIAALLARPVYGYAWQTILNWNALKTNWISVLAVLIAALLHKKTLNHST